MFRHECSCSSARRVSNFNSNVPQEVSTYTAIFVILTFPVIV